MSVLVADVGGTKTIVAVVDSNVVLKHTFKSREINLIEKINQVLKEAKEEKNIEISEAAIAVPGHVERGCCKTTNLPWFIDSKEILEKTLLKKVLLLNDFQAVGLGLTLLDHRNIEEIVQLPYDDYMAKPSQGVKAVIGAGTGLGKSIVLKNGHVTLPSEGGHADFVVETQEDYDLLHFLRVQKTTDLIDWESVVSGPGIVNIYKFLTKDKPENGLKKEIMSADDYSKPIMISRHREDETCLKTMEMFVRYFARCARNFALDILATGGVYLAGGIAPKELEMLRQGFMEEFVRGRFKDLLREIPVYVVMIEDAPLLGAARAIVKD